MNHKDLDVWKVSIDLVTLVYKHTENFPRSEQFGLTNQIRRSVISISSNIAEGSGRNSWKELHKFVSYSIGSAAELDTQLIIAKHLNYLNPEAETTLFPMIEKTRKLLSGYKKFVKSKME
ncbi:four helix bundle protein [Mesohalobacter halotolerans]|uniref:Four helix bundle protein n=1 Tax=Mesohalobacter halotolerans TaxID=1883405 RepID=A0A4U5TUM6_9FLAO|nr:four helix bundle protein [Mesohalobacter halotolerans]TKS56998.1 four helix bundle protein [Mesohalobacter halotolerans]